jgi:hypothetical protein
MAKFGYFILGVLVGAWIGYVSALHGEHGGKRVAYLNGGAISSGTVGVIYDYVDNMEGCSIQAAGMNYYYQSDEATRKKIMDAVGKSYCSERPLGN